MFAIQFRHIRLFSSLVLCWLLLIPTTTQAAIPLSTESHPGQFEPALDWQTITNQAEGFQVEIPAQWQVLELSEAEIALGLDISGENNPQVKALFDNPAFRQMFTNGVKLFAFDLSDNSVGYDLPANLNITKVDMGGNWPLTTLQKLNEYQLSSLAESSFPLRSQIITINGREALFFQYVIAYNLGFSEPQLTLMNQILLVKNSDQYILTVGIPLAAMNDYLEPMAQIVASFQLLPEQPTSTPVPSPMATPVPQTTATPPRRLLRRPTPTPASEAFAVVQVPQLNIRSGPGTNYGIIGSAKQNDRLLTIGKSDERCSWLKVRWGLGKIGWIGGPPTFSTIVGNCSDISVVPTPTPPPFVAAKPCIRFDNYFNKVVDVTLTMPANPQWNQKLNIAPHGKLTQCLSPGKYTVSIGVPGEGSVNGEFTLEKGGSLQVVPIYKEFN